MYGDVDLSKIGFTTSGKSRNQILTKLEEVLRKRQVRIHSSRFYEELKTFVWKNNKAQARKGANDDLVLSLAIGVWLYDTDPKYHKQTVDINKAMLEGFGVNSTQIGDTVLKDSAITTDGNNYTPDVRKKWPAEGDPMADLKWLLE